MIFLSLIQLFFTIYGVVLIFVFLFKMAVFFLFLRNVLLPIEILKVKILEHSDPPSPHFFLFIRPFFTLFYVAGRLCCVIWQNGTVRALIVRRLEDWENSKFNILLQEAKRCSQKQPRNPMKKKTDLKTSTPQSFLHK